MVLAVVVTEDSTKNLAFVTPPNFASDAPARPAKLQVGMALTPNSLARRKSRVQIPPPPPHIEHDRGTLVMLVLLYAFSCTQGGVVDAVPTRDHGVDQGQQLAPRMGGASPLA
jgi:hypothetical protein